MKISLKMPASITNATQGTSASIWGSVGVVVVFVVVAYVAWTYAEDDFRQRDAYRVSVDRVETTPMRGWFELDIAEEVLMGMNDPETLSLRDADLCENLADAFASHPWVEKVHRVQKHYPGRVVVQLEYRQPTCMVEMANGWHAIDREGVLLPSQPFREMDNRDAVLRRFPLLTGIRSRPVGPSGTRWGDVRVEDAAAITEAVGDRWNQWGLARITPSETPDPLVHEYTFWLVTHDAVEIDWGFAPGADVPGEPSTDEKLRALADYFDRHSTEEGVGRVDLRQLVREMKSDAADGSLASQGPLAE